jgi:hypothetical protein
MDDEPTSGVGQVSEPPAATPPATPEPIVYPTIGTERVLERDSGSVSAERREGGRVDNPNS